EKYRNVVVAFEPCVDAKRVRQGSRCRSGNVHGALNLRAVEITTSAANELQGIASAASPGVDANLTCGNATTIIGLVPVICPGECAVRVGVRLRFEIIGICAADASRPADEDIVASVSVQRIGASEAEDQVIAGRSVERIVAGRADDDAERTIVSELHAL